MTGWSSTTVLKQRKNFLSGTDRYQDMRSSRAQQGLFAHYCSISSSLLFSPFPTNFPSSPLLPQVRQRAADMKEALDLMTLLNEGGAVHNMMDGNFDFKQFQVNW